MNKYKRYYLIKKDILRRKLFCNNEKNYLILKFLKLNKRLLEVNKNLNMIDSYNLIINTKIDFFNSLRLSTIRNKCLFTGRNRSIYRDFRLSRMQLRQFASYGYLMGIKKASW